MTQIITITANPAIDVSTSIDRIAPFAKLRCAPAQRDPGGGGINVARVVNRLGGHSVALYPAGGATGQLLQGLMDREGVTSLTVPARNETREDFTVFEDTTHQQYRFVLPGAELSEVEWRGLLDTLSTASRPSYLVASGSLPPGVPEDFFGRVARIAQQLGAKAIVDTSGAPMKAALGEGLYLIKPNLREFQELTGSPATDDAALVAAGRGLIAQGAVELIALSLGHDGAVLIGRDQAWRADGLPIEPASVVGAGDSFLGALVWSLTREDSLEDALRYGVAAGSAALLHPGTELCRADDVRRLAPQVEVRSIKF